MPTIGTINKIIPTNNVANKKTDEAAVAACKARAACTETKATFTIGVNNGDTTVLDVLDYKND